jgi:FkbM family methyltransferase
MIDSTENIPWAPIVLFVYNRPEHTLKTLEALSQNELASESVLYIYADGPKVNASDEQLRLIEQTKEVIRERKWCEEVIIVESPENKGLARSIEEGVTEVVHKHGKIIVLEDDIVTSPGFLRYMNDALDIYQDEERVMHISAYMFPVNKKLPETFFYNTASCWGWATWLNAWQHYEKDAHKLLNSIVESSREYEFDIEGTFPFLEHLRMNVKGVIKTWAVKWYASFFLKKGFALHPYPSLTNNIGNDGSGVNSGDTSYYTWKKLADQIPVKKKIIQASIPARKAMQHYYRLRSKSKSSFTQKLKKGSKKYLSPEIRHQVKLLANSHYKAKYLEETRLKTLPRYTPVTTNYLDNKPLEIADAASFLFMYKEIFEREIYKFQSSRKAPLIVDCGANIGMSIIYFKKLYRNAEVIAFEPDKRIFGLLQKNVSSFHLNDVELINKGLWDKETTLNFEAEGADAGRVSGNENDNAISTIEVVKLSGYLNNTVDFLKIDIEGAELTVLQECKDKLTNVQNIFVEYHSFLDQEQTLEQILKILREAGFRYYIDAPGLASKNPFIEVRESLGMDMQLNIYGVRR